MQTVVVAIAIRRQNPGLDVQVAYGLSNVARGHDLELIRVDAVGGIARLDELARMTCRAVKNRPL